MFMHAEEGFSPGLNDGDLIGFIRLGNDLSENYYQVEIPLVKSPTTTLDPELVWPETNEINLPISALESIKSLAIYNGTLGNSSTTFFNVVDDVVDVEAIDEFSEYIIGQLRVGIRGNPNFGDIKALMVGIKNPRQDNMNVCGEVWFNELRLSDMENKGGWATTMALDSNIADFMNISATATQSTSGFGSIEQGPSQRDQVDMKQYDLVSNINIGQLFPKRWGLNMLYVD